MQVVAVIREPMAEYPANLHCSLPSTAVQAEESMDEAALFRVLLMYALPASSSPSV
jgi:hypothetical protein